MVGNPSLRTSFPQPARPSPFFLQRTVFLCPPPADWDLNPPGRPTRPGGLLGLTAPFRLTKQSQSCEQREPLRGAGLGRQSQSAYFLSTARSPFTVLPTENGFFVPSTGRLGFETRKANKAWRAPGVDRPVSSSVLRATRPLRGAGLGRQSQSAYFLSTARSPFTVLPTENGFFVPSTGRLGFEPTRKANKAWRAPGVDRPVSSYETISILRATRATPRSRPWSAIPVCVLPFHSPLALHRSSYRERFFCALHRQTGI